MSYQLLSRLNDKIDGVIEHFVYELIQQSIEVVTPLLVVSLSLWFILYGLKILQGAQDAPIVGFLSRALRIGVILSVALGQGWYQVELAEMLRHLPDELVSALDRHPGSLNLAELIDRETAVAFDRATEAYQQASFFQKDGLIYLSFATLILGATVALVGIGGAYYLLAKIAIALLVGLGPFFISSLLWSQTSRFFELWCAQILHYTIHMVLLAAVFTLMMTHFGAFMAQMDFTQSLNVGYSLGGMLVFVVAMLVILKQLPQISQALAGGASLSYGAELKQMRAQVGALAQVAQSGGQWLSQNTRYANLNAGAHAVGQKAATVGRGVYSYFKGGTPPKSSQ